MKRKKVYIADKLSYRKYYHGHEANGRWLHEFTGETLLRNDGRIVFLTDKTTGSTRSLYNYNGIPLRWKGEK